IEILLEVLSLEARRIAAIVVRLEIIDRLDVAGEESASDRTVGHESDAELAHRRQDLVLRLAAPDRVLGLKCGDRMDGMRAADRFRRRLRQSDEAHFAGADELTHRADRLLD